MHQETIPFWLDHAQLRTFPPLKTAIRCDVCIVGAGISGLTTAYLLSQSGKKVVVVDKLGKGCGAIVRNGIKK